MKTSLLALLLVQLVWLAGARAVIRVGWGTGPQPLPDHTVALGWTTNLADSLSYSSWLQQAKWGGMGAGILYTTTPHVPGYFNPFLWVLGQLAALTHTRPEAWLIAAGIIAALAGTAALYTLGHELGGNHVALVSALVGIFGSGWTWIQRLLPKAVGWDLYHAADTRFMDLLPSSASLHYPLHATGLALMAWLAWALLSAEKTVGPSARVRAGCLIALLGFLLAWIRPYEPAVLLGIYALHVALGFVSRDPLAGLRCRLWVVLFCAVAPGLLYSGWLALQPVWNHFSALGLNLAQNRLFWLQGFGGLWLAAGLGAWRWRALAGPPRFLVIWFAVVASLLLVANTPHTKLLSGAGIPIALLSGSGLVAISGWLRARWGSGLAWPATAGIALVLAGPGSLMLSIRESRLNPPRIDANLWAIGERLREDFPTGIPTVVCEHLAGGILPGTIGARVWAGHWALTDSDESKRERLRATGFEQDSPPASASRTLPALRALIKETDADYLLLQTTAPAATVLTELHGLRPVGRSGPWLLLAIDKAVP